MADSRSHTPEVAGSSPVPATLALLLLAALGCGTGTDGKPVAPPTTPAPAPAPEPPPEPPEAPSVRVVEVGEDFVEWAWEPVEGATGYEFYVEAPGTPSTEVVPLTYIEATSFRLDGLEPGTSWSLYVRAVRVTAGGRAAGRFGRIAAAETVPSPRTCTDERELALKHSRFVREWDGAPFRVDMLRSFPEVVTEADIVQLLEPVALLADKIEDQLGYRIVEAGAVIPVPEGVEPGWNTDEQRFRRTCPLPRDRGQIQGFYMDDTNHGTPETDGQANSACGSFSYMRPVLLDWPCPGCQKDALTLHELFHVLGFVHFDDYDFFARGRGVPMSAPLTWSDYGPGADTVVFSDIDLLRCIFPEGG